MVRPSYVALRDATLKHPRRPYQEGARAGPGRRLSVPRLHQPQPGKAAAESAEKTNGCAVEEAALLTASRRQAGHIPVPVELLGLDKTTSSNVLLIPANNGVETTRLYWQNLNRRRGIYRRNGLPAFSAPMVEPGPWPQRNDMSSPSGSSLVLIASINAAWSP